MKRSTSKSADFIPDFLRRLGVKPKEWQFALKSGYQVLMRTGWDLRVRVWAAIQVSTTGYKSELAVIQIAGPKIVPLTPSGLASFLQLRAIEEFRRSGKELNEEERKKQRPSLPNLRAILADSETEDGYLTRVRANLPIGKLIGLSYKEALALGHITPIAAITNPRERKQLSGRCCIYQHTEPRPATIAALTRHTDDVDAGGKTAVKVPLLKSAAVLARTEQLVFGFMREFGVTDDAMAARIAAKPRVRGAIQQFSGAEERLRKVIAEEVNRESKPAKAKAADDSRQESLFAAAAPPTRRDAENTPLVSAPRTAEVYRLLEVMRQYSRADAQSASDLLRSCRKNAPLCTVVQIAMEIHAKGDKAKRADNPVGFLLTAVPRMFEGGAQATQRIQPASIVKCSGCGRELGANETTVSGQCGDCLAAHYQTAPVAAAGD